MEASLVAEIITMLVVFFDHPLRADVPFLVLAGSLLPDVYGSRGDSLLERISEMVGPQLVSVVESVYEVTLCKSSLTERP